MNLIAAIFGWIFDPQPNGLCEGDGQFLAEAVDICDLERRMRVLDERHPFGPFGLNA